MKDALIKWCPAVTIVIVCMFCASGCGYSEEAAQEAAKFTDETAKAIIEAGWKIAASIIIAAVIRGCMNE